MKAKAKLLGIDLHMNKNVEATRKQADLESVELPVADLKVEMRTRSNAENQNSNADQPHSTEQEGVVSNPAQMQIDMHGQDTRVDEAETRPNLSFLKKAPLLPHQCRKVPRNFVNEKLPANLMQKRVAVIDSKVECSPLHCSLSTQRTLLKFKLLVIQCM